MVVETMQCPPGRQLNRQGSMQPGSKQMLTDGGRAAAAELISNAKIGFALSVVELVRLLPPQRRRLIEYVAVEAGSCQSLGSVLMAEDVLHTAWNEDRYVGKHRGLQRE